jgi:hypothetical protein
MTTDTHVLLVAVGGTRRREVVQGSAQLVATGAAATVVIGNPMAWKDESFDPRVSLVALSPHERSRLTLRLERRIVFTFPRLIFRLIEWGPLAPWALRAWGAYKRRIAVRIDRRIVIPLYRWITGDVRRSFLREQLSQGPHVGAVVITDPASITLAAWLRDQQLPAIADGARWSFRLDEHFPSYPASLRA